MNQAHAEGGKAEIGVGFFLAIAALFVAAFAAGAVCVCLLLQHYQTTALKDDIIRLEGEIQLLKLEHQK